MMPIACRAQAIQSPVTEVSRGAGKLSRCRRGAAAAAPFLLPKPVICGFSHLMDIPDYSYESALLAKGVARIAGVDEVGRGPLAGPVTAAAVVLDPARIPAGLNDSKALSPGRRQALLLAIMESASHLAMERAIAGLPFPPGHALIDGNMIPRGLTIPAQAIVKGDARCVSIAAASIVAKIARDKIMWDLAQQFPGYGWETNAGYPSKSHRLALQDLGVTPHHRHSFKPVHNILYQFKNVSN